ncbi:MAG: peptidoglycan editing factor PgeF [Alphaproteobacteria bacterium]|nr:peptidoglycan editing factor PgeF [Alphaproteobacteria bacterium]
MITSGVLGCDAGIHHAFFTRCGGVSEGLFGSLNCGFGSGDSQQSVARNRELAMARLGLSADRLVTCRQIHSVTVVTAERPWRREEAPSADGLVTAVPGIALGVLAADCAPILLHDPVAGVIGAAHGGWRGALGGIVEATIGHMKALGAESTRIRAAIGPCIGPASYEVGPEFQQAFLDDDPGNGRWFAPVLREGHFLFDLAGYIAERLVRGGVGRVDIAGNDTVAEEDRFFSYRRACLRGECSYGRGLSAIALAE